MKTRISTRLLATPMKTHLRELYSSLSRSAQRLRFTLSSDTVVLIVMYHAVSSLPSDRLGPWRYAVSPSRFEEQVKRLKRNYKVVTLDDVMKETDSSEDLAVVTFDDGYKNNLTNAFPVLEKHEVPATIYVSTGFIDGGVPYEYAVADKLLTSDSMSISLSGKDINERVDTPSSKMNTFQKIRDLARESPELRRDIFEEISSEDARVSMLDEDEIRELDSNPLITIGAHGHQHLPLASVSESVLEREVKECTTILEDILDNEVTHFSYPYGSNNSEVRRTVREHGYKTAVTTDASYIRVSDVHKKRHSLPRFDASSTGTR